MQDLIALVHKMTELAGETARLYFRTGFDVDHKSDMTPVTVADRQIEERLRDLIAKERPSDGFLGEEYQMKESQNGLMWIVDPIDGTKSFITGRPTFGTLIALWEGNVPLIGAIYQPITHELWLGLRGQPTTLNDKPIKTRKTGPNQKWRIGSTSPAQFNDHPGILEHLRKKSDFFLWGGDCYLYGLLSFGGLDIVVEDNLAPHDFAALIPIIQGAGGDCCNWQGAPLNINGPSSLVCIGDPALKDPLLEILSA
jgi:histidinol phosphatase-like enzyme (inositol monophosphatase family)